VQVRRLAQRPLAEVVVVVGVGALVQKKVSRSTISPMLCSTERFCRASICPPTSIGLRA
jgi:hypothetical protein